MKEREQMIKQWSLWNWVTGQVGTQHFYFLLWLLCMYYLIFLRMYTFILWSNHVSKYLLYCNTWKYIVFKMSSWDGKIQIDMGLRDHFYMHLPLRAAGIRYVTYWVRADEENNTLTNTQWKSEILNWAASPRTTPRSNSTRRVRN